jgi:hypothetical protein
MVPYPRGLPVIVTAMKKPQTSHSEKYHLAKPIVPMFQDIAVILVTTVKTSNLT